MEMIPYIGQAQNISTYADTTPHHQLISIDTCIQAWLNEKHGTSGS